MPLLHPNIQLAHSSAQTCFPLQALNSSSPNAGHAGCMYIGTFSRYATAHRTSYSYSYSYSTNRTTRENNLSKSLARASSSSSLPRLTIQPLPLLRPYVAVPSPQQVEGPKPGEFRPSNHGSKWRAAPLSACNPPRTSTRSAVEATHWCSSLASWVPAGKAHPAHESSAVR